MERHWDPIETRQLDLRGVRDEQLVWQLADHLVERQPKAIAEVLADLRASKSDEPRGELVDDVAPRYQRDAFRELGDDELSRDEQEPGVTQARRDLVLGREERARRQLAHDPIERDAQHDIRSTGRARSLHLTSTLSAGRHPTATGLIPAFWIDGRRRPDGRGD